MRNEKQLEDKASKMNAFEQPKPPCSEKTYMARTTHRATLVSRAARPGLRLFSSTSATAAAGTAPGELSRRRSLGSSGTHLAAAFHVPAVRARVSILMRGVGGRGARPLATDAVPVLVGLVPVRRRACDLSVFLLMKERKARRLSTMMNDRCWTQNEENTCDTRSSLNGRICTVC